MKIRELQEKRSGLIKAARDILEAADKESRDLTAEEQGNYDKAFDDATKLAADIERRQKLEKLEAAEAAAQQRARLAIGDEEERPDPEKRESPKDKEARELRSAFRQWVLNGRGALTPEQRGAFERRALSVGTAAEGGNLVAPEEFSLDLIKALDANTYIRQWGTGHPVKSANGIAIPSLDADPADATWTTELLTGGADSTMAFGKRTITPVPLAKRILVSNQLLRQSALPAESLVRDRLGYKFGVTWEKAGMTGTGSGQPLGVFVASASGIPAARDVSTDNGTTAPTFDGLTNAKYGLRQVYWQRSRWVMHQDVVKVVSKLKYSGSGEYIWRESTRAGEPDMLLGLPLFMNEFAPNTMTTGLYVGILGDFSYYHYADALDMQIQRLDELYAETNQTGFIGRLESDGQPVLGEAFVRVKLA